MSKIILLVILFNVVTAFIKNRNKRKREEALRGNGSSGNSGDTGVGKSGDGRDARDRVVSTSPEEAVSRKREAPVRADRKDDEIVQTWDEQTIRVEDEEEGGNPYREPTQSEPASQPAAKASKPAAPARATYASRNTRATSRDDDNARTVADSAPGADLTSAPGIAAVESANAEAYAARDPRRPSALTAVRADLFDPESLRRAFVLKTILDKPLSLNKPRAPGYSADRGGSGGPRPPS